MIEIPKKLKDLSFVLIGQYVDKKMTFGTGKNPAQKGWQKKTIKANNLELIKHLEQKFNYGVSCGDKSIITKDGETYFLIVIDFDKKEIQDQLINKFPETFTTTSGSSKDCVHLWFASDNDKSFKILDEKRETLIDVQGTGKQIIAPGSKHQSGSTYKILKDIDFAFVPYSEIEALLKPLDKSPKKPIKPKKEYSPKGMSGDIIQDIYNSVSMEQVLTEIGIDTSKNPTNCFLHSSNGGKCFLVNEETCKCYHCDGSWNKFSLIREAKNLTDKETFDWFAEKAGKTEELQKSRSEYSKKNSKKSLDSIFSRRGQIERFWNIQPFFYDKSKIFWLWNKESFCWEKSDEVDYLNSIQDLLGVETIDSKARTELIEGFKQIGRKNKPRDIKKSWVQFKDKIYDVKTGEIFEASPKYFVTNPINWKIGNSEETPIIDKLFEEWVGSSYKKSLYEFIAYSISLDKFMQRIFAFCGGGSNGKGTFIKLCYKFLGEQNCVASEIKSISENRFETARIYKKLLCVMGEVSYDDLKNTNQIKKIAGEDKLTFEFKGKDGITDDNTATCVCLTNSLPTTPDKSLGFYRKWFIIDFPNQFSGVKTDIIKKIPDAEFENLAKKSLRILKELYANPKFYNEGNFEDREKKYEERSNPVIQFVEEACVEEEGVKTLLRDFTNSCNDYLKKKKLRILTAKQIGKTLREEGFLVGNRTIDGHSAVVILNIKLSKLLKLSKSELELHREMNKDYDSFDSNNSFCDINFNELNLEDELNE